MLSQDCARHAPVSRHPCQIAQRDGCQAILLGHGRPSRLHLPQQLPQASRLEAAQAWIFVPRQHTHHLQACRSRSLCG